MELKSQEQLELRLKSEFELPYNAFEFGKRIFILDIVDENQSILLLE
jgi:hypothetical protein